MANLLLDKGSTDSARERHGLFRLWRLRSGPDALPIIFATLYLVRSWLFYAKFAYVAQEHVKLNLVKVGLRWGRAYAADQPSCTLVVDFRRRRNVLAFPMQTTSAAATGG